MLLTSCRLINADTVVLQHLLADTTIPDTMNDCTAKQDNGAYQLLADLNYLSRLQFKTTVLLSRI